MNILSSLTRSVSFAQISELVDNPQELKCLKRMTEGEEDKKRQGAEADVGKRTGKSGNGEGGEAGGGGGEREGEGGGGMRGEGK